MRIALLLTAALLTAALVGAAGPPERAVIVRVDQAEPAWGNGGLAEQLDRGLSRNAWLRVIKPGTLPRSAPGFPADVYNVDSLVAWGVEVGGRFLLYVEVRDERLERRKTLHLPLAFHKYETRAVVEGEIRLVDLDEGSLKIAEPFSVKRRAARVFQATMDDDIGDPDLKVSAPAKMRLFRKLEEELAAQIIERIESVLRGDE